jgi:hypothetical protein
MSTQEQEGDDAIGSLAWVVYEGTSGAIVGRGERLLLAEDVATKQGLAQDGRPFLTRHIALSHGFRLGLPTFPASMPDDVTGFGLTAEYEGERTYSWDWFTVDAPGYARKLQETGRLRFSLGRGDLGWVVRRIEFLTEVSLRILPLREGIDPGKPKWRVNVLPGSHLLLS